MENKLINYRMSDRFTFPINVYPQKRLYPMSIRRFQLVLKYGNGSGRISQHSTRECAEQSVRKYLELDLPGSWEIHPIGGDR